MCFAPGRLLSGPRWREYAVVFPPYYFGQIWEARHQPGCLTLPRELLDAVLQALCEEMRRNGFEKFLLVNGHGGNKFWLNYFCQSQLASRRITPCMSRNPRSPQTPRPVFARCEK